ncbi:MAG: head-tail joining protein [Gammaproteobacteria bacterium]
MAFTEDLAVFFSTADFAVTATWTPSGGGAQQTAQVILDTPDEELLDGRVLSREYAITYRAGQLTGLKGAELITVDAIAYTVREVGALQDGKIMRATLRKN